MPPTWLRLIGNNLATLQVNQTHIVYRFTQGLMPVKECYLWLRDKYIPIVYKATEKWAIDLNESADTLIQNWRALCGKYTRLFTPVLQDFHILFMNRSYQMNYIICKFVPISANCSFCDTVKETYVHVFFECKYVSFIWKKCRQFYIEHVDDDESEESLMSKQACLLSDFNTQLLVIISVIVKYRVFLARINRFPIQFLDVLQALKRHRDTHWLKCKGNPRKEMAYRQVWSSLASDAPFEEQIKIEQAALL